MDNILFTNKIVKEKLIDLVPHSIEIDDHSIKHFKTDKFGLGIGIFVLSTFLIYILFNVEFNELKLLISLLLFILISSFIIILINNKDIIRLNNNGLVYGRKFYQWKNIKDIELMHKYYSDTTDVYLIITLLSDSKFEVNITSIQGSLKEVCLYVFSYWMKYSNFNVYYKLNINQI